MEYSEIVEKIHHNAPLSISDITGYQLIKLLFDREIKNVRYHGNTFEINFIPITFSFTAASIIEEKLPTLEDGEILITKWIECHGTDTPIYITFEDNYFEIKLELMESA